MSNYYDRFLQAVKVGNSDDVQKFARKLEHIGNGMNIALYLLAGVSCLGLVVVLVLRIVHGLH